ncbi:MAG: hypothetical protein JWP97_549 [Labilithrix sp.]|nr:hypothetical protein [Labilithrix sp.]
MLPDLPRHIEHERRTEMQLGARVVGISSVAVDLTNRILEDLGQASCARRKRPAVTTGSS